METPKKRLAKIFPGLVIAAVVSIEFVLLFCMAEEQNRLQLRRIPEAAVLRALQLYWHKHATYPYRQDDDFNAILQVTAKESSIPIPNDHGWIIFHEVRSEFDAAQLAKHPLPNQLVYCVMKVNGKVSYLLFCSNYQKKVLYIHRGVEGKDILERPHRTQ